MYAILTILHVIVSVLLILIILLQSGKGAGISGIFGGGGEYLFSTPSGGSFLRKATVTLAVIFVVTSLSMTFVYSRKHFQSVTMTQQR